MNRSTRTSLLAAAAGAATLLALRPLVQSGAWLADALLVVAAVTATGIAAHRLARRDGAAVLAQLVVLAALLVVLHAPGTALGGVVPTGETLRRLARLAVEGGEVVQRQSVPVGDGPGLRLLLTAGAGLLVLAVDVLATRLRHPALAGLPLAAVYAVPLSLAPGGSGALSFVLAAGCYLLLLRSDVSSRERRWVPAARRGGAGGLGLAAAAVAAALVLPAAVPDLDERPVTLDLGQGESITVINPILNLRDSLGARSDTTVLVYETSEEDPAPLRIVTADEFDGETWAPRTGTDIPREQQVQEGLPAPPGLSDAVRAQASSQRTEIEVRNLNQTYLPLPYPAERVDIAGRWLYEADTLNVVGDDGQTTLGRRYAVTHLEVTPQEAALRGAGEAPQELRERYTELPGDLPESVRQEARRITEGARDDYERAVQLQRYFRSAGGFTYSTEVADDGGSDAVASFLATKSGFCVQFASAMAVMARSLDVPARVAIGFLPGERRADGRWRISARDAHAWPELYFEGTGWVRFEPTPATRTAAAPPWSLPAATPVQGTTGSMLPSPTSTAPGAAPVPSASATTTAGDPAAAAAAQGWSGSARDLPWAWFVLVALLLGSLLTPLVSDYALRRHRWRSVRDAGSAAEAAWADLADRTRDLGAAWPVSATPRRAAEQLAEFAELPAAEATALTSLRRSVERARFAPGAAPGGDRAVRADVDRIVAVVAAQQPRAVRWRARLWPTAGLRAMARHEVRLPLRRRAADAAPAPERESAPGRVPSGR